MTVGTDRYQFDRLIGWLDAFLLRNPGLTDETVVQHGNSSPSLLAQNRTFIPFDELMALMRSSDIVVTHAGAGSMFDARAQGRRPLCVPRDPTLGEIVDTHQQRFARRLARDSLILLAEDQPTFDRLLETALKEPPTVHVAEDSHRVRITAERIDAYVAGVVSTSRRRGRRA